jgi:hypothetical protein
VTDDITTVLIKLIQNADGSAAGYAGDRAGVQDSGADLLSAIADWAQIAGTIASPQVQAATAQQIASLSAQLAAQNAAINAATGMPAADQAALLATVAQNNSAEVAAVQLSASLIGVTITLGVSLVLGIISYLAGSDSAQSQQMAALIAEYNYILALTKNNYWDNLIGPNGNLSLLWIDVANDLDVVNSEGTTGPQVSQDQPNFFNDANKYLIQLTNSSNWQAYWQVTPSPNTFGPPQALKHPFSIGNVYENMWFGDWPTPAAVDTSNNEDPATFLPFLMVGINSWLSLNSLGGIINPAGGPDATLSYFLESFRSDLLNYLNLLADKYLLAVAGRGPGRSAPHWGIVKTAPAPSPDELEIYLQMYEWGNYWVPNPNAPWNSVYGALATYPSYGTHLTWPTYPYWPGNAGSTDVLQVCSASYFISRLDLTTDRQEGSYFYWVVPWIQNKVTLGSMARWKALYLVSGYDQVWQSLQTLQSMLNTDVVADPVRLDDGTIADGNWHARELCAVLTMGRVVHDPPGTPVPKRYSGPFLNVDGGFTVRLSGGATALSVDRLLRFLYLLGGSSGGPPAQPATRPLSFRSLLAAADDASRE